MPPAETSAPTTIEDVGVAGNEWLTSLAGAVLFVLLAVEGVTILALRVLFDVHVFVGVLLIGPILLKLGSTGYRFARYYSGSPRYRSKGPPHPLLRLIAPPLVVSTLVVVGSGVALLAVPPASSGLLLTLHKASFVVWFGLAAVHVLAYLWRVPRILARRPDSGAGSCTRAANEARLVLTALTVAASAVAAALVTPHAAAWVHWINSRGGGA